MLLAGCILKIPLLPVISITQTNETYMVKDSYTDKKSKPFLSIRSFILCKED